MTKLLTAVSKRAEEYIHAVNMIILVKQTISSNMTIFDLKSQTPSNSIIFYSSASSLMFYW